MISIVSYSYLCPWSVETPTASCLYPAVVDSVAFVAVVATVAAVAAGYSRPPARYPGSPRFPPFFFSFFSLSLSPLFNFTVPCLFFSFLFFFFLLLPLFSNLHERQPRHFFHRSGKWKTRFERDRSSHFAPFPLRGSTIRRDEASRCRTNRIRHVFDIGPQVEKLLSLPRVPAHTASFCSINEFFHTVRSQNVLLSLSLFFFLLLFLLSFSPISHISRDIIFLVLHGKCLLLFSFILFMDTLDLGWLVSYSFAFDSFLLLITFPLSFSLIAPPHTFYDQAIVNGLNQHVALLQRENSSKVAT